MRQGLKGDLRFDSVGGGDNISEAFNNPLVIKMNTNFWRRERFIDTVLESPSPISGT